MLGGLTLEQLLLKRFFQVILFQFRPGFGDLLHGVPQVVFAFRQRFLIDLCFGVIFTAQLLIRAIGFLQLFGVVQRMIGFIQFGHQVLDGSQSGGALLNCLFQHCLLAGEFLESRVDMVFVSFQVLDRIFSPGQGQLAYGHGSVQGCAPGLQLRCFFHKALECLFRRFILLSQRGNIAL